MGWFESVDSWFLVGLVSALGAFFVWAVQYIFNGIKVSIRELGASFAASIDELKKLITDLYEHRNDHESRLIALETKCAWEHGESGPVVPMRQGHGRRSKDNPKDKY